MDLPDGGSIVPESGGGEDARGAHSARKKGVQVQKKIGILTIGQSPRVDVVADITARFCVDVEVCEMGALDGLTLAQVKQYAPKAGMLALTTRMADGTEVVVAKEKLLPRLAAAVTALNERGVSLILLLCVGPFPEFPSRCLVVQPKRVVDKCVAGLVTDRNRLGVVIPIEEQRQWAQETFSPMTSQLTISVASPYGGEEAMKQAIGELTAAGCDLLILYCMGFNRTHATALRCGSGKPVLLSNSLVARVIGELLE